ncbi:sigma 54-interacting transcriptional regulator [Desulfobacterales bacterium HSG17]|nr:sigma 54-interacting transcriptional regulator [Desulfobacterales bacterium HSG17]
MLNDHNTSGKAQCFIDNFDFDNIDFVELFCNLDQGVLMTDEKGILIFYNEVLAKIDNQKPSDALGKKIADYYDYNNDSSTCMRVLKHKRPIINYALSYSTKNANVGNTIHSVFPLFKNDKIAGTICIVKDYNILERSIPAFLNPKNNETFGTGTVYTFANIIGSDTKFVNAIKTAKIAANSPSPVMIYGETGTGKELFAQAIHNFHYDKKKLYVDINCAAIPESLMESVLFGTVKGAYTGAVDRPGLFEAANGGTIFLDEINSMPLSLQGKLLRVLQEKAIRRVGSLENTPLNCKVICSVNEEPQKMVKCGTFRMDLFYRLAVVFISIPALRERLVDLEELGRHFLQKYNKMMNKKLKNISADVIDFFWKYSWPGNVRELQHIIEIAVNNTGHNDEVITLRHCSLANLLGSLKDNDQDQWDHVLANKTQSIDYIIPPKNSYDSSLLQETSTIEKKRISHALRRNRGNIAAAARDLHLSRQLLNYKVKKFNLRKTVEENRAAYRIKKRK